MKPFFTSVIAALALGLLSNPGLGADTTERTVSVVPQNPPEMKPMASHNSPAHQAARLVHEVYGVGILGNCCTHGAGVCAMTTMNVLPATRRQTVPPLPRQHGLRVRLLMLLAALACGMGLCGAADVFPAATWETPPPESVGLNAAKLVMAWNDAKIRSRDAENTALKLLAEACAIRTNAPAKGGMFFPPPGEV